MLNDIGSTRKDEQSLVMLPTVSVGQLPCTVSRDQIGRRSILFQGGGILGNYRRTTIWHCSPHVLCCSKTSCRCVAGKNVEQEYLLTSRSDESRYGHPLFRLSLGGR